ncbi:MAG TPA: arylamine N-acetyltransferase [Acidimicrobiales bacterium]
MALPDPLRDAYLARLGLDPEPPSVDALVRLFRAHVERVAYETVWIHAGERWGIDPTEAAVRIATRRRGGYCYHLNGAFSELLRTLGYVVDRHLGGVHGPAGPAEEALANHLVLTVRGLPSDDNPDGTWYVDVGLGDALYELLPLRAGTWRQGPFRLALAPDASGVGDWHLAHDPAGSFPGMAWRAAPVEMDAFAERHAWLSTSPESKFVRVLTAQRRDADGVDILRGLVLRRIGSGASDSAGPEASAAPASAGARPAEAVLASPTELADALGDVFGIGPLAPELLATLWGRVHAAHRAWEEAGRP